MDSKNEKDEIYIKVFFYLSCKCNNFKGIIKLDRSQIKKITSDPGEVRTPPVTTTLSQAIKF